MRIFMQTQPSEGKLLRFFQLHLQQDLLGGWMLVRESGIQGMRGQVKREFFEQREDAEEAMKQLREKQFKRGYLVVFREGC